ncbi:chromosome segregation ATPase [Companilactobacillus futsaii JCM 17355]|nr:chromosome segregation ATPase [Companilactobacillus futsaii JCM 17355]
MSKEMLTPVSFHLRNFNNYTSLDISASQNGNLTLIGENAAGKTTLANCFFPMLIDGSIATPSFNPAKGTDKLDKTTIRNSKNDTRTFEGMLLGWGRGSMKVRTGYSYMLMKSNKRQVIVGIGAHRAVGETRKPTWWFVMSSTNINEEMPLVTVDNKGQSLEREEFVQANEDWGINFRVFSQVSEFQN